MAGTTRSRRQTVRIGKTRGLYVDVEVTACHTKNLKEVTKSAIRRWKGWSKVDQSTLVDLLSSYRELSDSRDSMIAEAHQAEESARGTDEALQASLDACHLSQKAHRCVRGAADSLLHFYRSHECPQEVVDTTVTVIQEIDAHSMSIGNELQRLKSEYRQSDAAQGKALYHGANDHSSDRLRVIHDPDQRDLVALPTLPGKEKVTEWQGPFLVHRGPITLTTLFVGLDAGRRVVDMIVRKDVSFNMQFWTDASAWDGDVKDLQSRRPYEIACHEALCEATTSWIPQWSNVIGLRHSSIDSWRQTYTIYTELAAYGSLGDLINPRPVPQDILPEAFLWYVLLVLVECGLGMEYGNLMAEQQGDWQSIVHRDLKPANIFLADPNPDFFPSYPAPKLGDFGVAFRTSAQDPSNPGLYNNHHGTPGFMAPEQTKWWHEASRKPERAHPLGAHTNVFGTGLVMRALVTRRDPDQLYFSEVVPLWGTQQMSLARRFYTDVLMELIDACLEIHPDDRITFKELHNRMEAVLLGQDDANTLPEIATVRALARGTASRHVVEQNSIYHEHWTGDHDTPVRAGDARFELGSEWMGSDITKPLPVMNADLTSFIGSIGYAKSWSKYA